MTKKKSELAEHEDHRQPTKIITMADAARILATPDDVLMAWFREGEKKAWGMRNEQASKNSAKKNQGLESAS